VGRYGRRPQKFDESTEFKKKARSARGGKLCQGLLSITGNDAALETPQKNLGENIASRDIALTRDHAGEMGNSQSTHKISAQDRLDSALSALELLSDHK
jgi:hypothetical protein